KLNDGVGRSTIDLTLSVALPPPADENRTNISKAGFEAILSLKEEGKSKLRIRWTPAGDTADVDLRVLNNVIYLVPGTGELVTAGRQRTPAISILDSSAKTADHLRENLWRVLRQLNLRRAADEVRSTAF